jgi:hypothetical protein
LTNTYRKEFPDSAGGEYAQSREYQFLDLLNQLNASVPEVHSNNTKERYIEMAYVGVNLRDWLKELTSSAQSQSQAFYTLQQSLKIATDLAKLDVWHLDLALRNFVVKQSINSSHIEVFLIDFSLAVSKRFPLEKPLFMLPDERQQHPILYEAIKQDWQQYFHRNELAVPVKYDFLMEIPMGVYKADWSASLNVDRISQPWCVIAHSLGNMLSQCAQMSCFQENSKYELVKLAQRMLSHTIDAEAKISLKGTSDWIESNCSEATPRPIAKSTFVEAPIIQNVIKQDLTPSSPPSQPKNISDAKAIKLLQPNDPRNSLILKISLSIFTIAASFTLIDAFYVAYRIKVTSYTLSIAMGALAFLLGLICTLPFAASKFNVFRRIIQVQGLAIIGFSLELWLNFVPMQWPLLMTLIAIVLIRISELKNT